MYRQLQKGFTLLEVLVVIILTGLISTLLLQAIGFSLATYERSHNFQQRYQKEVLAFGWMRNSVENMMASDEPAFVFEGHSNELKGFSLAPMLSVSGSIVNARWSLQTRGDRQNLLYEENGGRPMLVYSFANTGARFKYRGINTAWRDQWLPEQPGILPWRIKLEVDGAADERDILMATKVRRMPRWDYRTFL